MASVYFKDGKWYLRWKDVTGKWRGKACQAETKKAAKRLADDLERRVERERLGLEVSAEDQECKTLGDLLRWWLTTYSKGTPSHHTNEKTIHKHFLKTEIGALPLPAATAGRIELFLQAKSRELSPQTVNHLRSYVSRAFNAGRRAGMYSGPNPVVDVKKRKVPRRTYDYLREHEVALLLQALKPRWLPLFATAIYAGLRKGELLGLRKSDVDLDRGLLTVARSYDRDTTKGGHADVIPIATELAPYLLLAMNQSPSELVFPNEKGRMMSKEVALEAVLRRALARAGIVEGYNHVCRRKGCGHSELAKDKAVRRCPTDQRKLWPKAIVRPIRFHDLRHTTASLLMMRGANPAAVQRILRHADPKITMDVYGHLSPQYLREEVDRLSFRPKEPAPFATPLLREPEPRLWTLEAPASSSAIVQRILLERAKRLELSTLSLGS